MSDRQPRATWRRMWRVTALASCAALAQCTNASPERTALDPLTALVDPFIGTGGHGHTFPGPSLPFGMIQPGPDTRLTGWDSCSGYHYSDARIFGFSHTHLSGTGIPDYGDVLLMPTTGDVRWNNGADGQPGYPSSFSHATEQASPGYYAVTLADTGVRAELTTTVRVGLHRYSFPMGRPAHVLLDLIHRDAVIDASVAVGDQQEVTGHRRSQGWAKDQRVFFVIRFSRPFVSWSLRNGRDAQRAAAATQGTAIQAAFDFADSRDPLLVKVGISAVSVDGARRNLEAELPGWDFEGVRAAADAAWARELARVTIEGGSRDQRVEFYTALYHAMLTPNVYMDVDGQYRGRDLQIHHADGFTYYSVFSLWDTFRALHPLLTILDPGRTADFVKTMLQQYRDGGRLPVWELAGNETDTMIGYHAIPVIADAIRHGVPGIDVAAALDAMVHSADDSRAGLDAYRRRGYIDAVDASESVSRTLEYAFDDWCIAQVAAKLGHRDLADRFSRRAQSWRHVFDPSTGFMRARVDGHWFAPFDPAEVNAHYTEANAWQYSFFVPQDVGGLIAALGGDAALVAKLDALFAASSQTTGRDQADITGLVGQYAHGNEPSHHIAYLYSYAGQPWKTQAMVRRLLDTMYAPKPDGEIGNDDCGQMSAWLVMSALGFYAVTPASGDYVIGTPWFPRATMHLATGRTFVIEGDAVSASSVYIQRAALDGADYTRAFLTAEAIAAGGTLRFTMGGAPNPRWGSATADRPSTQPPASLVVPVPFVAGGAAVFRDRATVTLGDADASASLHYSIDGSTPTAASPRYTAPIAIAATTTVRALAASGDGRVSPVLDATFTRLPPGRRLTLSAAYANQYNAGGPDALIDTLRGGPDFRNGRWQGYRGTDLTAVVDLGGAQRVSSIAMGFLQDAGSWILMPKRVRFEVSADGEHYRDVGTVSSTTSDRETGTITRDYAVTFPASTVRFVRVTVERYGTLPDWHPGSGEESWFFADEIKVGSDLTPP